MESILAQGSEHTLFDLLVMIGDYFVDCFTIVEIGDERRCLYSNAAFTENTGYLPEEAVGRNLSFLQGEYTSRAVVDAMRRSLDERAAFCGDVHNYRKDGSVFLNRLVLLPIVRQGEGLFLGFQNVVPPPALTSGDVSRSEINHMLNNPLAALLLKVDEAIARGDDLTPVLKNCSEIFKRINTFCRHIDQPERFADFNPFRAKT
jgi:PAS domain S-box-containing protein